MLSTFECPTKFFYNFILKRVPGSGKSIDLHAGGCMASAFESIRIDFYRHHLPLEQCFERAFAQFTKNWGLVETKEGQYKDFINCWCAIEAYFHKYPPDTDFFQPYIKGDGSPAVEFRFGIPINLLHPDTGNPILFSGRADLLAQNEPSTCYVVDEKTTKGIGASWPYQWDMRGQFYGYTWAARHMGFPCAGALVRGIAIQQTQFAFAEKPIFYTQWQLDNWHRNMVEKISRMIYLYELTKEIIEKGGGPEEVHAVWPMSFGDSCSNYGGCVYTDVCTKQAPWEFYHDDEVREWNPLEHNPTAASEDRVAAMGELSFKEFLGLE